MLKRFFIYSLGFLLPPIMLGLVLAFSSASELMLHKRPDPVAPPEKAQSKAPRKWKALIVISNSGTQVTDLLGPYEILAESGLFDVSTVAPALEISPTTGAVSVYPDYSFKNAPDADLLVIPALMETPNAEFLAFIKEKAAQAKVVLSVCEGGRILAETGLLSGKNATGTTLAMDDLKKRYPDVRWQTGPRYVLDEKFITSAGVTASLDATLGAIKKMAGVALSHATAAHLHYEPKIDVKTEKLSRWDFFQLFMRGGYAWGKREVSIFLYPGVSELGLAGLLDTFPRTLANRVATFAPKRMIIRSRHGLMLVPTYSYTDLFFTDLVLVPSGKPQAGDPNHEIQEWNSHQSSADPSPVKSFLYDEPGVAYDRAFELMLKIGETKGMTRVAAKTIEYPTLVKADPGEFWKTQPWMKPILVGLLGIFLVWMMEQRMNKKRG